jgi:hypothetical protein
MKVIKQKSIKGKSAQFELMSFDFYLNREILALAIYCLVEFINVLRIYEVKYVTANGNVNRVLKEII